MVQTLHNYRLACPAASFYRDGKICEECLDRGPFHAVRYGCYRDSKLATAALAAMLELHRRKNTWSEMVDCYVALTEFAREKMIQGGLPAEKIRVKPNFVLPDPGPRGGNGAYALFVGRLVDLKRRWHADPSLEQVTSDDSAGHRRRWTISSGDGKADC